ncbi:LuxR C-terminal-related transcriptional regulator [Streptomyces sp. NPDC048516]|uniref:LuxR C-terminal-related transcriptional regulator n=1 Tax=Streptomyces sp. NPDC048516 TaxID=3365565 RepID=UPI00371108CB
MLEELGLDCDEELVYRMMLGRPRISVKELTAELGWPIDRMAAVVKDLKRMELIRPSAEDPRQMRLVNPELGLEALLLRQERELLERQEAMAATRLSITRILAEYGEDDSGSEPPGVRQFMGMDAIGSQIERYGHSCTSEVAVFAPRGAQTEEALEAARPLDRAALSRGVRLRYVYLESLRNDPPTLSYAQWLNESGGQVRTMPQLPLRMIIYDGRTAIVPIDPEAAAKGVLILNGTGVVIALCTLFDQIWQQAQPLGGHTRRPCSDGDGLTSQERAVLELLVAGHTDEVVARKLGISVRTGRRITAELMRRLQARSRFQAGAVATARGWLTPTAEPSVGL